MFTKLFERISPRKRILRSLSIDEISAADKPAQEGARMVFAKRADGEPFVKVSDAPVHILVDDLAKARRSDTKELDSTEMHFENLRTHIAFGAKGRGEVTRKLAVLFDNEWRGAPHGQTAKTSFALAWNQL